MMKDLDLLTRRNIIRLKQYAEESGEKKGCILLDNNENPYNAPYNRYPDPLQTELKKKISRIMRVYPDCIFLGNGADEAIDTVYRCFVEPGRDNVVAIEPTFGAYRRLAEVNGAEYRGVELGEDFQLSADKILRACDGRTKAVWLCSPNDPTGNLLDRGEMEKIISRFDGFVVVDETYADFSKSAPLRHELHKYPNLILLSSFSKAWGCAGINVGMAFAHPEVIDVFNKVKYPYNINSLTIEEMSRQLDKKYEVDKLTGILIMERDRVMEAFSLLPTCKKVYPTDANFFIAEMTNAELVCNYLRSKNIIVRNISSMASCQNCLRITIGSKTENSELLSALRQFKA